MFYQRLKESSFIRKLISKKYFFYIIKEMAYEPKHCTKCNKTISYKNWSHHIKTRKHGSINSSPGAAATKHCDKCNKTITHRNWSHHIKTSAHNGKTTVKGLRAHAKEINLKGFTKLNKQKLQSSLDKATLNQYDENVLKMKSKKDLLKLTQDLTARMKKSEIIDAILKQQDAKSREDFSKSFSDEFEFESRERKTEHSIIEVQTALENRLKTYLITNKKGILDINHFLEDVQGSVINKIRSAGMDLKVNLVLLADFKKGIGKQAEYLEKNFKTQNEVILNATDLGEYFNRASGKIMREMESFEARGSNWALRRIKSLELRLNKYIPLRGASYMELPDVIRKKRAIINVKNSDNKCFLWSILSALHPAHYNVEKQSSYTKFQHEFDEALKGLEFPLRLCDIPKFERKSGISVNVFAYDEEQKCVHPLMITKHKTNKHVNLFYTQDEKNSHYCWIKNMSALIQSQMSKDTK